MRDVGKYWIHYEKQGSIELTSGVLVNINKSATVGNLTAGAAPEETKLASTFPASARSNPLEGKLRTMPERCLTLSSNLDQSKKQRRRLAMIYPLDEESGHILKRQERFLENLQLAQVGVFNILESLIWALEGSQSDPLHSPLFLMTLLWNLEGSQPDPVNTFNVLKIYITAKGLTQRLESWAPGQTDIYSIVNSRT